MAASITLAGESLIAQKQAASQPLKITNFVLANVPGLNPNGPVNRAAGKPPAGQIVYTWPVTQDGYVNPNQVVYSLMMGTDVGDFDWNWIGLESSEGVLLSVAYVPVQQKRKNILPEQIGNNVTRNFLVVFDGAQQLTGIKVDASTWQHDFTARLRGIDERERQSNRDMFGRACFFSSGLALEKVGSAYQLKPGIGYVEGIRLERTTAQPVAVPSVPNKAWLDVVLQRELSDVVGTFQVVFAATKEDYTDSAGARHYLVPLADLPSTTVITDLRPIEPVTGELIKYWAAQNGDYPNLRARATTKADVKLDQIPNAISDSETSNSSSVLATTKMVTTVRGLLWNAIDAIIQGTSVAGKAARLATARTFKFKGAATGSATFDGSADADITLTLADSGAAAGFYTKVSINQKGLVVGGDNPTTLAGYGITDGYTKTAANASFVKQGGGLNQLTNSVYIGWSSRGLVATVDATDLGLVWCESNFNPGSKANWSTSLAGYGITDAFTKTEANNTFIKQGGGPNQLGNRLNIGWSGTAIRMAVDGNDLGVIWGQNNFDPNSKANKATTLGGYGITDCYTAGQVNSYLDARVVGDSLTYAGFASDNPEYPYFRRRTDGAIHYLQRRLGFTPVQQGGGYRQGSSTIRLGWSTDGAGIRAQVDSTDMGILWNESNFYRPDSNNFLAVQLTGTSVQLPPGGTWCYSLMHYYLAGQGVVGKSGQAAGGTVISFTGGATIYGFAWRYAP
ncbi:phage tail protein [Pseudomonas sp. VE 196-7]|uniref:phage tail protein n=1 Tax=Pseudomonas sp. VE 196-7 TaxID=2956726 RepID=UPI0021D49494|nr:phage tail protein [Pseudomonas sp. VE 196-7]MCU7215102.1 phage tail protein [Pseudomonas sp. VE 196-7]